MNAEEIFYAVVLVVAVAGQLFSGWSIWYERRAAKSRRSDAIAVSVQTAANEATADERRELIHEIQELRLEVRKLRDAMDMSGALMRVD
jgi:hypothetical protein